MTRYRCLAVSAEGRQDWRYVDAPDEQAAVSRLVLDGYTPVSIRSGDMTFIERLNQPVRFRRQLALSEQALLLSQLATLNRSGLPIDRSLDLLREQAPRAAQRAMISGLLSEVRAGQSLAAAFERSSAFPAFVTGVVRAAERSGNLGQALESLAEQTGAMVATRRQLVTALTYPAAVLAATVVALLLVLTFVVPQFEPIFAGEEERLPRLTRMVLAMSGAAREHGLLLLILFASLPAALVYGVRYGAGRMPVRWRNRVPGLALRDQYLSAQFTGLLGTLTGNGVTLVRALPLVASTMASPRWKAHIESTTTRVREGRSLSSALAAEKLLPGTAVRLIEVGERSGRMADTCLRASEILGAAARARIDRIVSLANPVAIVSLGAIVAAMVAGVMLGIFALGDFAG